MLIIEDDKNTAEIVKDGLIADYHTVEIALDGAEGSFLARSYEYDVIILDYSLPKKNGLTVCREIRESGKTTPILFLSMTDDNDTKIKAFESGADDYVTKPFSLTELYARIKAVTRRPQNISDPILKVHDLCMDTRKNIVTRNDKPIHLTRKEFSLLEYFMRNTGILLSRALIMEHVWTADSDPFSNTVEAHIRNVRKKINMDNYPNLIANVPGRGYIMDTPENISKF